MPAAAMRRRRLRLPGFAAMLDAVAADPGAYGRVLLPLHARLLHLGIAGHRFLRPKLIAAYASFPHLLPHSLRLVSFSLSAHSSLPPFALSRLPPSASLPYLTPRHFALLLRDAASAPSLPTVAALHAAALRRSAIPAPALISAYSASGDLPSARRVFDELPLRERFVPARTALAGALATHGQCREVLALFPGVEELDDKAVTVVLAACARAGMVEEGRRVFGRVRWPVLQHYTCMVELLGRAGEVEEAERLVLGMDVAPDRVIWGVLFAACQVHGRVDVAERIVSWRKAGEHGAMVDSGLSLDRSMPEDATLSPAS